MYSAVLATNIRCDLHLAVGNNGISMRKKWWLQIVLACFILCARQPCVSVACNLVIPYSNCFVRYIIKIALDISENGLDRVPRISEHRSWGSTNLWYDIWKYLSIQNVKQHLKTNLFIDINWTYFLMVKNTLIFMLKGFPGMIKNTLINGSCRALSFDSLLLK